MRPQILVFGIGAHHDTITPLTTIGEAVSISDFDAFVMDPLHLQNQLPTELLKRRRIELQELIVKKGGIVICLLRPNDLKIPMPGVGIFDRYSLLDAIPGNVGNLVRQNIESGTGSKIKYINSARGPTSSYLQVLRTKLTFTAFAQNSREGALGSAATVFALNSVGYPVAFEFRVGEGVVSFVPVPQDVPGERFSAALVKVVATHFDKRTDIEAPQWVESVVVPGAKPYDAKIAELKVEMQELANEISSLEANRDEITNHVRLLFAYGKGVLEPQVRSALRLIGFTVREPDEYKGEWDIDLTDMQSNTTAIGEVEGSEGVVDVDKYRQLLDYVAAETAEGRNHKGLLIGNGFRLTPPEAPERFQQFSDHARRGADRFQFCLLPTTELFKAVCAVMESPEDESLKAAIRYSMLHTVGSWSFVHESQAAPTDPPPSVQSRLGDPSDGSVNR